MRMGAWGLASCLLWGAAHGADWQPMVSPEGELFPALIIATAGMPSATAAATDRVIGDSNGLVGATVRAQYDSQRVRLVVRLPGLARESTIEATLPVAGRRYELYPTMRWNFAALRALRQPTPETLEFELALDAAAGEKKSVRVRVRSINDAPYFAASRDGDADLSWIFAAFVNEDHPLVETILAEALATGIVDRFDGYQSGNAEQVYRQAFAIWDVLRRRGIRYSSITRTSSPNAKVLSQHVRFLDESWRNTQANCVDGSVLFASVLRKIDIEPSLVLVPGHMLLAFDLDRAGGERAYLETTMLGEKRRGPDPSEPQSRESAEDESFAHFEAAVERGFAQYLEAEAKLADPREPEYVLVPIAAARELGVMPIAPL